MFPKRQIPVYLFTGFLDAGKTKFINETLMGDKRFTEGKNILLILCEEGEEEYEPTLFAHDNVYCGVIDEQDDLSPAALGKLAEGRNLDLVLLEYNGMWALDNLYRAFPEGWVVAQETAFFDATTILTYNANMRAQVVDKLQSCDLAVFNRVKKGDDIIFLRKIIKGSADDSYGIEVAKLAGIPSEIIKNEGGRRRGCVFGIGFSCAQANNVRTVLGSARIIPKSWS